MVSGQRKKHSHFETLIGHNLRGSQSRAGEQRDPADHLPAQPPGSRSWLSAPTSSPSQFSHDNTVSLYWRPFSTQLRAGGGLLAGILGNIPHCPSNPPRLTTHTLHVCLVPLNPSCHLGISPTCPLLPETPKPEEGALVWGLYRDKGGGWGSLSNRGDFPSPTQLYRPTTAALDRPRLPPQMPIYTSQPGVQLRPELWARPLNAVLAMSPLRPETSYKVIR